MNICAVCKRDFASVRAFDGHRVGSYRRGRRCLDEAELREHGFVQNAYGRWTLDGDARRARSRFSAAGVPQDGQRREDVAPGTSAGGSDNPRTASELRALALVVLGVLEDAGVLTPLDVLAWSEEIRA